MATNAQPGVFNAAGHGNGKSKTDLLNRDGTWYHYDDGINVDGVGANGSPFWWGVMFPGGSYSGNKMKKVAAYDFESMTGTLSIYQGGTTSPGILLRSIDITFAGVGDFVEFEFETPIEIDNSQNVWVVFYNETNLQCYPAAVCANTGYPNGRWVSLDGNVWEDLLSYGLDGIFMIRMYMEPGGPPVTEVYDFEDNTLQGWTTIDADGDGYEWKLASGHYSTPPPGHEGSSDFVLSQSWSGSALYPDNYLVSPNKGKYSNISFWACAQDLNYPAEHFGVAVSTTGNTNPSDFTTIQEWTMTAKGNLHKAPRGSRDQGDWYEYTVDLSEYAGQDIWLAIRHFNCSDNFVINVDDITIALAPIPSINVYTINVTANPAEYGVVTGGGDYEKGTSCTIKAIPNAEYEFINWTKDGMEVSTNAEYTFTVTEDATYVANFQFDNVMEKEEDNLVIYPNPIYNKIIVQSEFTVSQCDIYSVTGALMLTMTVDSDTFEVHLGHLPAGSYLMRLVSDDKVMTHRFVKR